MIRKVFAIQLDGEVTLGRFQSALDAWQATLEAVSSEVGEGQPHRILINDLAYGSAIAAVHIEFAQEPVARAFDREFASVARSVRSDSIVDLPRNLQNPARKLRAAAKLDSGEGFTLSTDDADYMIRATDAATQVRPLKVQDNLEALGAVAGMLQSLSSRGALRAYLFDDLSDKAVRISLTEEQHEVVRDLWDRKVVIEGIVRRDPDSGRPLSITKVKKIYRQEELQDPFAWRKARGVLAHIRPEMSAEELVREARNA